MFVYGGFYMPGEKAGLGKVGEGNKSCPPQFFSNANAKEENKQLLKLFSDQEWLEMSLPTSWKSNIG